MSAPSVSERGVQIPASAMRKLAPLAADAAKRGVKVYHLNIGQPDIETPPEFWDAVEDFSERTLAYGPSNGRADCVDAWIEYYARLGIDVTPEQVVVTTAGSEALLFALLACGDAGDELIVPEPYYSNYGGFAAMCGMHLVPVTTRAEDGYRLPPRQDIERIVAGRTRAILYSSPGNPTGAVYTRGEVGILGDLARSHGLFLLADEVYREFTYDGQAATSALHLDGLEDHIVVVDSVSKRFSACGARIGCVVSRNESLMAVIRRLAMTRLSAPVLEQVGAAGCVKTSPAYFDHIRDEYARRRDIVFECANRMDGVFCPKPAGAFYAMVRIDGVDTEEFARYLLTDFEQDGETVMIAPGAGFYCTHGLGRDEIRIAYVLATEKLSRAMDLLAVAIRQFRKM